MHSFFLLVASCVTAAAEPQTPGYTYNPQTVPGNVTYYEPAPVPTTFRARLRNFLGWGSSPRPQPTQMMQPTNMMQPTQMMQPVPTSMPTYPTAPPTQAEPPLAPTESPTNTVHTTAYRPKTPLPEKIQDKVGHEPDYTWITGQLFYVHTDGGRWVLRYGQLDEMDKYGGSVVLAPTVEMRNFREGDLVCVHGQVVEEGRASPTLSGPLYRVNSINMVDRSDP